LVEELRRAGYDARGIDPAGRATAGSAIERRALGDHTDADLDAVVMWHVLEHLDDPRAALRRVHGWLRPGGLLLVGVPNLDSWQRALAGERWLHYDVPRHRMHFTPAGLGALLRAAGFEPGGVRHLVWEQNPIGMALAPVRRPGRTLRAARRGRAGAAGLGLAVALAVPAEALAAAARRGGTVACVAVRR
jgi:SAM-dependent methyltransferase